MTLAGHCGDPLDLPVRQSFQSRGGLSRCSQERLLSQMVRQSTSTVSSLSMPLDGARQGQRFFDGSPEVGRSPRWRCDARDHLRVIARQRGSDVGDARGSQLRAAVRTAICRF